ncbi:MAG: SDR family oxidoreductase [Alphaproteobacteria bacterium]|nr:SDR family oxidoreductase [Alphaproteobacteria bacterium]
MRLAGKAAIVTGAGSGIGRASAQLFAAEGAEVLAVDLPGRGLGEAHRDVLRISILEKSVADADAPASIIGAALTLFGRLDILMNNAGVAVNAPAEATSDADWERTLAVNLTAPFRLCRAAIPHLKASGAGRIINVASVMAEGTDYGLAAYCASKAGVGGLTRTLALELGKFGITANYLLPGAIQTGMTMPLWEVRPDVAALWAKKAALKRLGVPADLARGAFPCFGR